MPEFKAIPTPTFNFQTLMVGNSCQAEKMMRSVSGSGTVSPVATIGVITGLLIGHMTLQNFINIIGADFKGPCVNS